MTSIVQGEQSGFDASRAQYSEDTVYIRDNTGNLIGKRFAESVYHANVVKNMLELTDLYVTHEMVEFVKRLLPSMGLKIKKFFISSSSV